MANHLNREDLLQRDNVRQMIAERAYYISEQQGFAPGRDQEHWFQAETELVDEMLTVNGTENAASVSAAVASEVSESVQPEAPVKKTRSRKTATTVEGAATPRKTTRKKSS